MNLLGWTLIQCDGVLIKRGKLDKDRQAQGGQQCTEAEMQGECQARGKGETGVMRP